MSSSSDSVTLSKEILTLKLKEILSLVTPRTIRYIERDLSEESSKEKIQNLIKQRPPQPQEQTQQQEQIQPQEQEQIQPQEQRPPQSQEQIQQEQKANEIKITYKSKLSNDDLYIFTDGNCKRNGKSDSIGALGVYIPQLDILDIKKVNNPTNQKCELLAIKSALDLIKTLNEKKYKSVIICTDSMYSINCITKWCKNWERNNWKTSKGEDVKHSELIKSMNLIYKEMGEFTQIQFKHIYSHTTKPKNNSDSIEYFIWNGNKYIDDQINQFLEK